MSKITLYVDLSRRTLVTRDGGTFTMPQITLGDYPTFVLKPMERSSSGTLTNAELHLRTLRASIGAVLTPPSSGAFTLRLSPNNSSASLAFNASSSAIKSAIIALPENATYDLVDVQSSPEAGCWLLRFNYTGEVPLSVKTNRLSPSSFVRVRAFVKNGQWWHELRLIQSPLAFTGSHERVLADAPSVRRIREGSPRVEGSSINTNEVQALRVPDDFVGTYYLQFDYRSSRLIGIEDGPEEIADALNAMWTDGKKRFVVTNPEEENAYIEFVGELEASPQPLITVSVHTFRQGEINFSINLETAELAAALRDVPSAQFPFEVEAEVVDTAEDVGNQLVQGSIITLFSAPITIVREQIWEELATVPAIDWMRPPQPVDYIPMSPNQVITGQQHLIATIGDGVKRTFTFDHDLDTRDLHVTVRERTGNFRVLLPSEFEVTIPSVNSTTIKFPASEPAPSSAQYVMTITAAGPKSVFLAHHHSIEEVDGLMPVIEALFLRVTALEDLMPSGPGVRVNADAEKVAEFDIPDFTEMYPGKFSADFDAAAAADDKSKLPRPAGLLPAIHDATTEAIAVPLPSPAGSAGKVYFNGGSQPLLVPGGLGRRGGLLEPDGFAGSDGRVWYRMSRGGETNSYYPMDFERELFMLHVNDQMLRVGSAFILDFKIAIRLLNSVSRAQYVLKIDVGSAPKDTSPSPTGDNLKNIVWLTEPIISQRLIVSDMKITHRFGATIRRAINGNLTAEKMAYGNWAIASSAPTSANFTLRARLVEFDTENSVRNAKGTVFLELKEAKANIN